MLIHLMQHGVCLSKELDPHQPLSPVGREQIEKSARAAQILGLRFELVVASPKVRSLETAKIMAEQTGYPSSRIQVTDVVKAMTPAKKTLDYIRDYNGLESILIVGHLPSLGALASHILTTITPVDIAIENGGLMQLQMNMKETYGTLNWYLTPTQLAVIGLN
ncbi:phosphohistidine phosphatase SixA [Pseudodesulfovibrio nedwellii]|uniref:Phosphohistidine phosphatase SixA n=1 Tax=Pseudodesulfovibrio nedwellii TaxID=2973072 RepID=A0ABM8AXJ6_9BACT|nr:MULTISPECIES: histidine phosphatase family protein [Pseudodesulfovibrio]BDQ36031.1 phosphohistidine phosphatase SixA [Pseudodesulfovibrio nedwellii]